MPWALRENLVLAGLPKVGHIEKYGWGGDVGILTLSHKAPPSQLVLDDRVKWWKHIPLADGQIKDMNSVVRARDTALGMMAAGYFTIIHCMAGRNRSGLVGALVLREIENLTGEDAMILVRELRPGAVDNIHFEQFLLSLPKPRPY